jgi:hypothetical protein
VEGRPPEYPLRLYMALVLGAVGLALIIIGLGGATGWALIAPGFAAVIVALVVIWRAQASTLRAASKTPRR